MPDDRNYVRVQHTFPPELVEEVERVAHDLMLSRSALVRQALAEFIRRHDRRVAQATS